VGADRDDIEWIWEVGEGCGVGHIMVGEAGGSMQGGAKSGTGAK
jgi:hypothetical protein